MLPMNDDDRKPRWRMIVEMSIVYALVSLPILALLYTFYVAYYGR